jgi:hypothetical protein
MSAIDRTFTAAELGQAAYEVALATALFLIREGGDGETAIEGLIEAGIPTEGDEVLDVTAISAQAIRMALDMGVVAR